MTRQEAVMAALSRAHLTEAELVEDLALALRPYLLAEVRDSAVAALTDLVNQHPRAKEAGAHWDGCWKAHPECAIQASIQTVERVTGS